MGFNSGFKGLINISISLSMVNDRHHGPNVHIGTFK